MALSEARKRANKKWMDEHGHRYERLNLNLRVGEAEQFKAQAIKRGYSGVSEYIRELITQDMKKDED